MSSVRALTLAVVACSLCLLPLPVTAQIPRPLQGIWIARNSAEAIPRLSIAEADAEVIWRNETIRCKLAAQAGALPPNLVVATFRCATSVGLLQLGITRPSEMLLVVNVVSPLDPAMTLQVFVRPTAATKPPPPTGPPPVPKDGPPPPVVAPPGDPIPQFPWPPPQWTLRTVLPPGLGVATEGEQLGIIFDRLREALRRAQISEWTVYGIDSDGFALVARLEHIDDTGQPAADRWSGNSRPKTFSIADYLQALFTAKPGRYRVIAFVVTARAVVAGPVAADREMIERLWQGGASDLPTRVRTTPLPPSGRVEALVYEFFRPSQDDPATQVTTSQLTVPLHLAGAGLWRIEDLTK